MVGLLACASPSVASERADLALLLAVDVSGSMDEGRYAVQMGGIARALEDPAIQAAMLSGRHRAVLLALMQWSDRPTMSLNWTLITGAEDATAFAREVRALARAPGEFTCMSRALRAAADKWMLRTPVPVDRLVIDVSGDGHDDCNPKEPVDAVRDDLAAGGVTVNGLPILDGDEAATVETWYREHVVGGVGSFVVPAHGYADFARAMHEKFAIEVAEAGRPSIRYAGR